MARILVSAFLLLVLVSVIISSAFAREGLSAPPRTESIKRPLITPAPPFPSVYFTEDIKTELNEQRSRFYWVATEAESQAALRRVSDYQSILLNNDVLAFYGSPLSKRMGILGMYPIPQLDKVLSGYATTYDTLNGSRGVVKAFYVIYGMAWPGGNIGILDEERLYQYLDYALKKKILVFVDHQIGKYTVEEAIQSILPFLRYPNVHLALDPEWRTLKPMKEIGSVTAQEINKAQEMMEAYLVEHGYPGERMLMIHQFNTKMIQNRSQLRSDFSRVRLVHSADGFGPPRVKLESYQSNAQARNVPVKAFKLFLKTTVPGAGFDSPLLRPEEVLSLNPRPSVIIYQ